MDLFRHSLGATRYHYGFELDGKKIISEWLYSFPLDAKRSTRTILFHRDSEESPEFYFGKSLKGENKQIAKLVRPNSLFLSAAAQNAHPALSELYSFVSTKVTTRFGEGQLAHQLAVQLLAYFGDDVARRKEALDFLAAADIGVTDIDFSKIPRDQKSKGLIQDFEQLVSKHFEGNVLVADLFPEDQHRIKLFHKGSNGKNYAIPLEGESAGTVPEAVAKAAKNGIDIAFSNPCFEVWPLLHLENYGAQDGRAEVQARLTAVMPKYNHEIGAYVDFEQIKDKFDIAFDRAKAHVCAREQENCALGNPCTTVGFLIKKIVENGKRQP